MSSSSEERTIVAEKIRNFNMLPPETQYKIRLYCYDNRNVLSSRKLVPIIERDYGVKVAHTSITRWFKEKPAPPKQAYVLNKRRNGRTGKVEDYEIVAFMDLIKNELEDRLKGKLTTADKLITITESNIIRKEQISSVVDQLVLERTTRMALGEHVNYKELVALAKVSEAYSLKPNEILKIAGLADINHQDKADSQLLLFNEEGEFVVTEQKPEHKPN